MNKLIKYFNEKYGKEYGKISYPRTTLQIYQVYQIIKDCNIEDSELQTFLQGIKLPKPKTIEEREMYSECFGEIGILDSEYNTLTTADKTIIGGINELNSQFKDIAKNKIYKFNSVQDMKSSTILKIGNICETLSYYKDYNLGGAKYKIISRGENGDIIEGGIELDNGNIALLIESEVNVYQFGAKGDGVTDDTEAIQKALNFANDVYLKQGVFAVTSITVNKHNNLIGCGIEKFTEMPKVNNEYVFQNYIKSIGTNDIVIINNGTIKDTNFIGNSDNEFVIKNEDANLINISIHGGKTALKQLGNHMHIVRNINISWTDLDGIFFECADSTFYNIQIIRCGRDGISGSLSASSIVQGKIEYCYENCINTNYFTQVNITNMIIDTAVKYLLYNSNVIDKVCFSSCIFIGGNLNNDASYDSQIYLRKYGGGAFFNGCRFVKITAGKKEDDVTNLKYCIDCDMTGQPNTLYNCCGYTANFTSFFKVERDSFKTSLVFSINN